MDISHFINFKDKWLNTIGNLILLTIIIYLLHWLGYSIYTYSLTPKFIKDSPGAIVIVAFLIYLIISFLLIRIFLKKVWIFALHLKNKTYLFSSQDFPSKWIFNGRVYPENTSDFIIWSCRAGCILRNHYWKNFKMSFQMKFIEGLDRKVGIIFAAEDLDNYFMLELSDKQAEFRPHVRYHGGWDVVHPIKTNALSSSDFIKVDFNVKNDIAYLKINGNLELTWILPTHVDVMYVESGGEKSKESVPDEKYVKEIPFRNKEGMVGFRAHPGQGAIIRGLKVEPL